MVMRMKRQEKLLFEAIEKTDADSASLQIKDVATKRQWTVTSNRHIASGGFGRLYDREKFLKEKKLKLLGIPLQYANGISAIGDYKFRYLIMQKFKLTLFDIMNNNLTSKILNDYPKFDKMFNSLVLALEFIHTNNFVHGDIKPENIMFETDNDITKPYLIDFGLASKYIDSAGNHVKKVSEKKYQCNGTLRYCPIDSHNGFPIVRRSDLEMLAYSLIECLILKLPWSSMPNSDDTNHVLKGKQILMDNPNSLSDYFPDNLGDHYKKIHNLLEYLKRLDFESKPDYMSLYTPSRQLIEQEKKSKVKMPESTGNLHNKRKRADNISHNPVDKDKSVKKMKIGEESNIKQTKAAIKQLSKKEMKIIKSNECKTELKKALPRKFRPPTKN